MPQTPRHQQIVHLLRERGECSVESLAREFGVSDMTIRRDLQRLAEDGQLIRTHGGAAPAEQVMFEFQFLHRSRLHQPAKDQIAAAAADLVRDGQSVLLDSGTTTLAIARHLRDRRRLTVITTSLPIASVLQHAAGIETLLLGGYVRRESPDLAGPLTESNLENLRADVAFIGADGIDLSGNVYNASLGVARMLEKMAGSAKEFYVVADASKLNRTALITFGNASRWQGVITDPTASAEHVAALRNAGVRVIIAGRDDRPNQPTINQSNNHPANQPTETVHG